MGGGRADRRVIRAPNHLGDVVASLPAIIADGADVIVLRSLAPVLEMAGPKGEVLPLDRGPRGFVRAVRGLRRRKYESGVLLTPAFSAAWLFRWGGVHHLRGTSTDARSFLLHERVPRESLAPHHRINGYRLLLGTDPSGPVRALPLVPPESRVTYWRARIANGPEALVGLFPGTNAPARRWPAERFTELARRVATSGARLVVMGGVREMSLTARVADSTPRAVDVGGRTDVIDLAAILSLCDLVVTNDTGPMHLAGAVGTPTVSLWGPSDPDEVRQVGAPDLRVTGPGLPCKPCYRNHCARRGVGTILAEAREECMRLIEVEDVLRAVDSALARSRNGG